MTLPPRCRAGLTAMAILAMVMVTGCDDRSAVEPGWLDPPQPESSTVVVAPAPVRPTGQFFGETHRYQDGLGVRVSELTTAVLGWFPTTSDEDAQAGSPYTVISVRLDNHTPAAVETAFTGRVFYGPELTEAHVVYLDQAPAPRTVTPGQVSTHEFGFLIPEEHRDDVVFELGVDVLEHEKAYFVGSVRTS